MEVIQGMRDCLPEQTGYDGSRIDVLQERLSEMIERKMIHGASYCISLKGKIIAYGSVGSGDATDASVAMQPDTVFGVASITKVFTATAVMQLVEDGRIRLDTPVGEIIPSFAEAPFSEITVLHLLTHTSGLYPDEGCFSESMPYSPWELIDTAWDYHKKCGKTMEDFDWVRAGISGGLRVPVGSQWQYNSFGFCLLGEIVSRVSGMFVHDYIEKKILRPLQMKDSTFTVTPELAKRHFVRDTENKEYLSQLAEGVLQQEENIWDRIPSTGGGMHATVYDLVRFGNAFVENGRLDRRRILGRKSVEKMATVQLHGVPDYCWGAKEENRLYGIGFDMRQGPAYMYSEGTIMHEGAGACSLDIDRKEQLVAAWFVPFHIVEGGWSAEPLYNIQNIIWSGLV